YRRLRYCRYADDFVLGIIGTKDEVEAIMSAVKTFIEDDLRLSISEEKTSISTGKKGVEFLGYRISVYRDEKTIRTKIKGRYTKRRTIADTIRLQVPKDRPQRFCQKYGYGDWYKMKPTHRPSLSQASDVEIIQTYNAELRGFANYYSLAQNVKAKTSRLEYMSNYSLFKTLAFKHKTRMTKIIAQLKQENDYVYCYEVKGKKRFVPVFKRKHMTNKPINQTNVDEMPNFHRIISPKSELVKRLNRKECEYCKRTDLSLESHHVRKLKDLKQKPNREKWQQVMIARNRKTLVICTECHHLLHAGKLPDLRYKEKS
ncbi:MAG: HNH endonuclease, partial [Planctomycetota bacterium]